MHPLKPYFLGTRAPPHPRVTTLPEDVPHGRHRHHRHDHAAPDVLRDARATSRSATTSSARRCGSPGSCRPTASASTPSDIWITVFAGDDELGLGPDEEAIEAWLEVGVPRERIVECPRSENFWQVGPTGPCGPCSELYLDRGVEFGKPDDLPGGDNERFLEYWNLVFMQFDQNPVNTLTPLPAQEHRHRPRAQPAGGDPPGQGDGVRDRPVRAADRARRGAVRARATARTSRPTGRCGCSPTTRRAMTFLIADGVVPSNEDRGYVLRRIMRRAIQQGRSARARPGLPVRYADRVTELMGDEYPELHEQRDSIQKWLASEEEGFGRTLEQGLQAARRADRARARDRRGGDRGRRRVPAARHLRLPDRPDARARRRARPRRRRGGLRGADGGAARRARAPAPAATAGGERTARAGARARRQRRLRDRLRRLRDDRRRRRRSARSRATTDGVLVKLVESPFYATGGGQVADSGYVECAGRRLPRAGRGRAAARRRPGARRSCPSAGTLEVGERVHAHVDRAARHATECNHTATHLLHAALRQRLGDARPAGRLVRRARQAALRLHPRQRADAEELADVEDQVNGWILESQPVRALTTTLEEARAARRDGAVRREVRRRRADGRGRRRLVLARAVRRHARPHDRRDRAVQDPQRDLERRQRAPDRGAHRAGGGRADARARPRARRGRGGAARARPSRSPTRSTELRARVRELERAARQARPNDAVDVDALAAARRRARRSARAGRRACEARRRQGAARGRRPAQGQARRRGDRARQRRRGPRRPGRERRARRSSSAACGPARSSGWPRPWSAAAAAGATRWRAPAGATRRAPEASRLPRGDRGRARRATSSRCAS